MLLAALASALVHVLFVIAVKEAPVKPPLRPPSSPITITFDARPLSQQALPSDNPNDRASRPTTVLPRAKPPEPKDTPRPDGQIVKLPPPKKEERPDKARFVSEHDQKADEEKKSKKTSNDATAANEFKKENHANSDEDDGKNTREAEEAKHEEPELLGGRRQLRMPLFGDSVAAPTTGALLGMWRASTPGQGGEGSEGGEDRDEREGDGSGDDGKKSLALSSEAASRIAGGAPANDALPDDIPEGSGLMLNAHQWKYASYFNRISDALRRQWRPGDVIRRRRDDPMLSRARRRHTLCEITLDRDGRVMKVRVERLSGIDYLDDEAVRAIRAAGPFPNPPLGLFEGKDEFSFRFGFQVNFEDGPGMFRVPGFGGY